MDRETMFELILDSYPYPIVFVDTDHIIRYVNRCGRYHYNVERGYEDLIGKSIFDCHMNQASRDKIEESVKKLANHSMEVFLGVSPRNQQIYINPVRDAQGKLVGYFERFEMNIQK